jgi:uncharacterized protein (TIGR01777 family)
MRVAVSGGTGFIGRALVERLCKEGHDVTVLSRSSSTSKLPSGARLRAFQADGADEGALSGIEAVVNLAGAPIAQRWSNAGKDRILQSRVQTTRALVKAAIEAQSVRTFVSASAVGYYGASDDTPLDEDSPQGSDFLASVCGAWEHEAKSAAEAGIRTCVLRLGVVLHPEGGALKPLSTQFRLGAGGRVGSGRQYVSWIHREDVVSLFVFALGSPLAAGPYNGTAPNPVTNLELARALARALHRPAFLATPAFVLRAALGEMSMALLEGQRVLPKRTLAAGFRFEYPDLPRALERLLSDRPR